MPIPPRARCQVLIFLKWPAAGETKTRLALSTGDAVACQIYQKMAEDTVRIARSLPAPDWRVTVLSAGASVDDFHEWLGDEVTVEPQGEGDLGCRLSTAFQNAFSPESPPGRADFAIALGGDCPGITAAHLQQTYASLATHEVVLGPATDGGYYLLGARRNVEGVFARIDWSTEQVFAQTMERCRKKKYRVHTLEYLRDVDVLADAQAYGLVANRNEPNAAKDAG